MSIDLTLIHQAFFEEASDLLNDFEAQLLHLESAPEDKEILNSIFRCAHSIKGGSATFGFPEVARFTHSLETLLDDVRNGQVLVTSPLCALLLESLDQMRALLAVAQNEATEAPDSDELIARIEQASDSKTAADDDDGWGLLGTPVMYDLNFLPGSGSLREGFDPLTIFDNLRQVAEFLRLDADLSSLPAFEEMDPEELYLSWSTAIISSESSDRILEVFADIAHDSKIELMKMGGEPLLVETAYASAPSVNVQKAAVTTPTGQTVSKDSGTIKVSSEKLDTLINLVGELIISQSMLNSVTQDFELSKLPQLTEAVSAMERASRELQERVMAIRLLQIKMAFGRFPRLVHDLSSKVGKTIELRLSGEETELDKNLIEAIGDPLTHLVRNSVDHGLETPDERENVGKPRVGVLSISAFHEGGSIVIEVADDGKGLNREKIV